MRLETYLTSLHRLISIYKISFSANLSSWYSVVKLSHNQIKVIVPFRLSATSCSSTFKNKCETMIETNVNKFRNRNSTSQKRWWCTQQVGPSKGRVLRTESGRMLATLLVNDFLYWTRMSWRHFVSYRVNVHGFLELFYAIHDKDFLMGLSFFPIERNCVQTISE